MMLPQSPAHIQHQITSGAEIWMVVSISYATEHHLNCVSASIEAHSAPPTKQRRSSGIVGPAETSEQGMYSLPHHDQHMLKTYILMQHLQGYHNISQSEHERHRWLRMRMCPPQSGPATGGRNPLVPHPESITKFFKYIHMQRGNGIDKIQQASGENAAGVCRIRISDVASVIRSVWSIFKGSTLDLGSQQYQHAN